MKKRLLSLLLALCLVLTVIPGTAWAASAEETGETEESGEPAGTPQISLEATNGVYHDIRSFQEKNPNFSEWAENMLGFKIGLSGATFATDTANEGARSRQNWKICYNGRELTNDEWPNKFNDILVYWDNPGLRLDIRYVIPQNGDIITIQALPGAFEDSNQPSNVITYKFVGLDIPQNIRVISENGQLPTAIVCEMDTKYEEYVAFYVRLSSDTGPYKRGDVYKIFNTPYATRKFSSFTQKENGKWECTYQLLPEGWIDEVKEDGILKESVYEAIICPHGLMAHSNFTWTPSEITGGEDQSGGLDRDDSGAYYVQSNDDLKIMTNMIGSMAAGDSYHFIVGANSYNGNSFPTYTFESAANIPQGAEVWLELRDCILAADGTDPAIVNRGKLTVTGWPDHKDNDINIVNKGEMIFGDINNSFDPVNNGTIVNEAGARLTVLNGVVGRLENNGTLVVGPEEYDRYSHYIAKVEVLVTSSSDVTLRQSGWVYDLICMDGTDITLRDGMIWSGINLKGSSKLTLTNSVNISMYFEKGINLEGTSQLVIDTPDYVHEIEAPITVADGAKLEMRRGGYTINPSAYIPEEGYTVTRITKDQTLTGAGNGYYVSKIEASATAPEMRVYSYYRNDGSIDVSISSDTQGAQVYCSTDPDADLIDTYENALQYRSLTVPNGSTIYATAVKVGCPANHLVQTINLLPNVKVDPTENREGYDGSVTVTMSMPAGFSNAEIRYMLADMIYSGSSNNNWGTAGYHVDPNFTFNWDAATKYTAPITLTKSAFVVAQAKDGESESSVFWRGYRINNGSGNTGSSGSGNTGNSGTGVGSLPGTFLPDNFYPNTSPSTPSGGMTVPSSPAATPSTPSQTEQPVAPEVPVQPEQPAVQPVESVFADIAPTAWYKEAASFVSTRGLMTGTSDNEFSPNEKMTRAMLWTVLGRLDGADVEGTGNGWYAKAQSWIVEKGISDGRNAGSEISRQEMVTMLWRYMGSPTTAGGLNQFSDSDDVAGWAGAALQWAVANGIIEGSDGKLNPLNSATRAEVATILMRFCEKFVN